MEERFRKKGQALLGKWFEELLHLEPLRLPQGARCPHCGIGTLSQNGFRCKLVETTLGAIRLRRAYYVCDQAECTQGLYPLDLKLGLGRDRASPELHQIQMEVAQAMSFESAATLLNNLLGGTISSRQTEESVRNFVFGAWICSVVNTECIGIRHYYSTLKITALKPSLSRD